MELDIKRLYLPVVLKVPCTFCNAINGVDISKNYLSYPDLDTPMNMSHTCDKCDQEFTYKAVLSFKLEVV